MNSQDLVNLLQQACSQTNPEAVKLAESRLGELNKNPIFVTSLAQVYGEIGLQKEIRLTAVLQLKHALDKHWKPREFSLTLEHRAGIKHIFLEALPNEKDTSIAIQSALIVAKIIRKDGNGSWPELFSALHAKIKSENELLKFHCSMTLKELIKMMKSKRLPADRKLFHSLAVDIWPIAANLWTESQSQILNSSDPNQLLWRLNSARYGLKILKTLSTHGSSDPTECPNIQHLVNNIMKQMPLILEAYNQGIQSIPDSGREIFAKLVTLHAKILRALSDDYYVVLNGIQERLLQFAAEIVATGRSRFSSIPPRFIVNLMIIIKQFSAIARDYQINEEDGNVTVGQLTAKRTASGFYVDQNLTTLVRYLIMDYLQISPADIESWEESPEDYMTEEKQEVWKYDVRPCSEVLVLSLVHHYQASLVPTLVNMVSEVQEVILPKIAFDEKGQPDQNVLIADAVLNAIGLSSYELANQVDFDSWFTTTLCPLVKNTNSKILKRRVAWLISQWVCVKFSDDLRPTLYRLLLDMMMPDQDIVVRLESALALKISIDDFNYNPSQFVDFQHEACTKLFNILTSCEECDTKMRVLYIYSLILKRQRGLMKISIDQLTEYLPALWEHAEDHHLLRGAIVCLLLELTLSITSESVSLYKLLIPIINTSCNPHSIFYLYLADDGLDLWLAVLQTAPMLTAELGQLLEILPSILQSGSENIKTIFKIIECYVLLDLKAFVMSSFFGPICSVLQEIFIESNEDSLILQVKFIQCFILSARSNEMPSLPVDILKLVNLCLTKLDQKPGPVLKSIIYSAVGHTMLNFKTIGLEIMKSINGNDFIREWCLALDSITHHDRRKISALLYLELLETKQISDEMVNSIVCSVVEVLSDLGVRTELDGVTLPEPEDNLRLTGKEIEKIIQRSKPEEPAELWIDLRKQRVQITNLAYSENLISRIRMVIGLFQAVYTSKVDEKVREQLEFLVSGKSTGWGCADKDKIFTQSGGERLATDSWH